MKARGYTLIEVIIVVTILAIFVGVFMFFSGDFVLRARLDVSADTVLAAFSNVQEEVKSGVRVPTDPVARCSGLKLQADGVFRVFAPYDPAGDVPCDIFSYSVSEEIVFDEHIYFRDFMVGSDVVILPLVVLYEPPHGAIRIFADMGSGLVLIDKNVSFLVSYGQEGNVFKKIEVDVAIGRARFLQ